MRKVKLNAELSKEVYGYFKDIIKGVTLSDVVSTAIGLAGMNSSST